MTSQTDDQREGLRPPQFGLRTMLLSVGGLCLFLAIAKILGGSAAAVLVLFVLSVVAHVAGNAIGTRLRDGRNKKELEAPFASTAAPLADSAFAPTTRLSQRSKLGLIVLVCIVVGAGISAVLGAWLLAALPDKKNSVLSMSIGIGAFAILGGFAGFVTSSFVKVLWGANAEAIQNGTLAEPIEEKTVNAQEH